MPSAPPVELRRAVLEELELPLVRPFTTSFGTERRRRVLLLTLEERSGEQGYAECVAGRDPLYSYESVSTAREVLTRYLLPLLAKGGPIDPATFSQRAGAIRGHPMAKAVVEMALFDLSARTAHVPLQRLLASPRSRLRTRVEVGVSVGMQSSPGTLVDQVREYREQGYHRIKLKIEPGRDRAFVRAVRRAFPQAPLWVDANQAYGAKDLAPLVRLARESRAELVEQPFPEDAWSLHARLARALPTFSRLCLDESVTSRATFDLALELGATSTLNIKPGRVGGLLESVRLHDRAVRAHLPVWCGGMLETGIGRAHNLHLASLPGFRLPSDLSASDRYWEEDLVDPPFALQPGSCLIVPRGTGVGVEPLERVVRRFRVRRGSFPLRRRLRRGGPSGG